VAGSLRNLQAEAKRRLETFDARVVRALKDRDWRTFTGCPGLRIERHGKARTWVYRYRSPVDNRSRRIKLGRWPATGWESAWTSWKAFSRARDDGADPQLERRAKRNEARTKHRIEVEAKRLDAVTTEKLVRLFLKEHIEKECRTEKAKYDAMRMFESRVLPQLGDRPAVAIDRSDAKDFLARVKLEAPAIARLLRSRLGGAWDHAIDRKLLPRDHANPWRGILTGKLKGKPRSRYLDDAELATFLASGPRVEDTDIRDALLLTLFTAARSGEVVAMDFDAVDLRRATWTLHETKTVAPRTVRLPRQAVEILKRRGRAFQIAQPALAAAIREAKHFGLRPFTPHDLRRSARTGLSRLGVRDEIAEAALGHVEGGIRGTYNLHAYEAEVGEALQKWCDHLDALASPKVASSTSKS
jgi:integrase